MAFHDGHEVRLYKEPEPAGDSPWLAFTQERRLPTRLLISPIRHATRGALSLANTQPFARELGGRAHLFAHNGGLEGIDDRFAASKVRFRPAVDTDSEMAFCLLLERLSPLWDGGTIPPLAARLAAARRPTGSSHRRGRGASSAPAPSMLRRQCRPASPSSRAPDFRKSRFWLAFP